VVEPETQRVACALHSPPHTPSPVHTLGQGACGWSVPVASQREGVSFAPQVRVPGLHEPVQAVVSPLPLQAKLQVTGVSRQSPRTSHCWMALLDGLHCRSPGVQPMVHAPVFASQSGSIGGQGSSSS
jgi:hypothetical protein